MAEINLGHPQAQQKDHIPDTGQVICRINPCRLVRQVKQFGG